MSSGTKSLTFAYNADGQRIAMTYVNGETTTEARYYYAGNQLAKMTRGDKTLVFTYDSLGPRSVVYNGSNYYYLRNAQGDILGIVSAYGAVVTSYTYDAWGNVLSVTGSMSGTLGTLNPLRYRGYVYDTETKLYYLNSRYYNPATGRFINADTPTVTLLSPGSATWDKNLFAYCDNDPVMRIDAGGQLWTVWATFCTVSGAFIGGVTQVVSNISTGEHWSDGLFGAIAGGAAYGAVIGTTGNEVAASYASAAASSFVDRAVSYIPGLAEFNGNDSVRELTGKNIANSLADTLVDTAVKGTTTAITSKAVGKIIPVDHKNWIKPEKLTSCLFGNFGMKNTGQSVLQGGIMWGTSILKKAAKTLLK